MANAVIPASSSTAETDRTDHAQWAYPWYARTSLETRRVHPIVRSRSPANISRVLHISLIPANAGKMRWPTQKTITAMNPTVSACREAPHIPPEESQTAAPIQVLLPPTASRRPCGRRMGNWGGLHVFSAPVALIRTFATPQLPEMYSPQRRQSLQLPIPRASKERPQRSPPAHPRAVGNELV